MLLSRLARTNARGRGAVLSSSLFFRDCGRGFGLGRVDDAAETGDGVGANGI